MAIASKPIMCQTATPVTTARRIRDATTHLKTGPRKRTRTAHHDRGIHDHSTSSSTILTPPPIEPDRCATRFDITMLPTPQRAP